MSPTIWKYKFLETFTDPIAAYKSDIEDQELDALPSDELNQVAKGAEEADEFLAACEALLKGERDPESLPEQLGEAGDSFRLLKVGSWKGSFYLDEKANLCVGFRSERQN